MRIYIDEAGPFLAPNPPRPLFSLVLALVIPRAAEGELLYEFLRLRDTWPTQSVEIKGSTLHESQAADLIRLVLRYETFVEFVALDMKMHPDAVVEELRNRQADAITANITREHHPGPIPHLHQLGESIRRMSNQLFVQAFATWELVVRTIREGMLYFVQRLPEELGDIAWVVDRKDRTLTEMEDTWSTLILGMSEHVFGREPLGFLAGADYSYFDAKYVMTEETAGPEMRSHIRWLRSMYAKPKEGSAIIDISRILKDQLTFDNSRDSLGLQLADMLASILRRALNDRLQYSGWKDFGGLLVRHKNPGHGFIAAGPGPETALSGHAKKVCQILNARARSMLVDDETRRT
jgi:hypothetical protein